MRLKEILAAKLRRKQQEDEEEEPVDVARDEEREASDKEEGEAQGEEPGDAPSTKKRSLLSLVMFVTLVLLTGALVYKRLPSASYLYKKDLPGNKRDAVSPASSPAAAPQATVAAAPSSPPAAASGETGGSSPAGSASSPAVPPALPQQQKPVSPAQPVQVAPASTASASQPKRSIYLPARDILSGSSTAELQKQEEVNRLLEARVKELKLKNDIKKIEGDIEILPFQVTEKKKDLTEKIEKKANLQPVLITEKESRPPTLYSVQMIEGVMTGSFTLMTGEQVRARAGDWVGEFVVRELTHNSAALEGRNGRRHLVSMSFPERYPVSSPLFGTKSSGTGPSAQAAPAVAVPASRQPVPVPISPVGRQ